MTFFSFPEYKSKASSSSKEKTENKNRSKLGSLLLSVNFRPLFQLIKCSIALRKIMTVFCLFAFAWMQCFMLSGSRIVAVKIGMIKKERLV